MQKSFLANTAYERLIDVLRSQGHRLRCVLWHLKRFHSGITYDLLSAHVAATRCFSLIPDDNESHVVPWHFVPPAVPRILAGTAPELLRIRGLPGSGKTRAATAYAHTHVHVEADAYFWDGHGAMRWDGGAQARAHYWCQLWTAAALRERQNVVVANTFVQQDELDPYYHIAAQTGASVRLQMTPFPATLHRVGTMSVGRLRQYRQRWESDVHPSSSYPLSFRDDGLVSAKDPAWDRVAPFCQPGICPAQQGERWLQTVGLALQIDAQARAFQPDTTRDDTSHDLLQRLVDIEWMTVALYEAHAERLGLLPLRDVVPDDANPHTMLAHFRQSLHTIDGSLQYLRKQADMATQTPDVSFQTSRIQLDVPQGTYQENGEAQN